MAKCSQCGKKIVKNKEIVVKYGGASYCDSECFEKAKQFMKENGIILT